MRNQIASTLWLITSWSLALINRSLLTSLRRTLLMKILFLESTSTIQPFLVGSHQKIKRILFQNKTYCMNYHMYILYIIIFSSDSPQAIKLRKPFLNQNLWLYLWFLIMVSEKSMPSNNLFFIFNRYLIIYEDLEHLRKGYQIMNKNLN